jgi:hypothetical protein
LSQLIGAPHWVNQLPALSRSRGGQAWTAYVYSYLTYQALRERSSTCPLGRVRRAAQAICEFDGDTRPETVSGCLTSLIRLAALRDVSALLRQPSDEPSKCSDSDLKADLAADLEADLEADLGADLYVAAIYLGKTAYVARVIAEGVDYPGSKVYSTIFGDSFRAATIQGNLEMIKLLLSCVPKDNNDSDHMLSRYQGDVLIDAGRFGHQAAFNFALDMRPLNIPKHEVERRAHCETWFLEGALAGTPWPDNYQRAAAILGSHRKMFLPRGMRSLNGWLHSSAAAGQEEMVRYFLGKGATPNTPGAYRFRSPNVRGERNLKPLLLAIRHGHEMTTRILLDAGADPNWYTPDDTPLMTAVVSGIFLPLSSFSFFPFLVALIQPSI